jgi:predicted RNA-binding Zn-ribbon protein involved in translation (DUF1610 family)
MACTLIGLAIWPGFLTIVLCIASTIGVVVAARHLESWRCPQCGETFFRRGLWHNGFAGQCMNCGLAKWSVPNAASNPDSTSLRGE